MSLQHSIGQVLSTPQCGSPDNAQKSRPTKGVSPYISNLYRLEIYRNSDIPDYSSCPTKICSTFTHVDHLIENTDSNKQWLSCDSITPSPTIFMRNLRSVAKGKARALGAAEKRWRGMAVQFELWPLCLKGYSFM
ncbi:hypothetical protein OIDMADRAFT_146491 [Oidiodendron maius Zn]|uniref:Uncharacterized protein n=1 Tax=Oidiodendron maius (strain Zn) TaxID=913774 RepID=A0A0C3H8S7_OIDMZ|nr:hypothetical protein OIDMADRAFT_146491 [Oidiodendron maius Zn]